MPLCSFSYYVIACVKIIYFYTKAHKSYHSVIIAASFLNLDPEAQFFFIS